MIELLIQIPGPIFLIYFIGLSLISIVVGWLWVKADGSTEYHLPELTRFDPFIIATLPDGPSSITQPSEPIGRELEELHLVRTETDRLRAWKITMLMCLIITGVGGTKLYFGITRGRPIGFLIVLLIISLIVLFVALKPWGILTRLGRLYVNDLGKAFPEVFGKPRYQPKAGSFFGGWIGGGCGGGDGGGCGGGCGGCGGD